jgi:DNA-binding NtrC family response regulator
MPVLTIRDGARSTARLVLSEQPLDTLCPSPPPYPYTRGWRVRPEGDALALVSPEGVRQGTLSPGAALSVGAVTLGVEDEPWSGGDTHRGTERLQNGAPTPLALSLPGHGTLALGSRIVTLGKNSRCDVVIHDTTVSGLHCRIIPTRDGWLVRDAASTNGTFVGGVRVESALLTDGVTLTLGRTRIVVTRVAASIEQATSRIGIDGVLVGDSPGMFAVRDAIRRYARSPYPVLVQGETGSGKELVARMLHDYSPRARGPFVAVNAGAIAPDLVESELFGHERGAFTGALTRRRGVFEEASGGTLFLDELGELPLAQQAKLLRVLETHEVRRIGGEGTIKVDFRIVCATHRDLASRVATGAFRADLLYRLDLLRVAIPPLRERTGDIEGLAKHLLARIADETGRVRRLDDTARSALIAHDWPGNVRELYGVLCRAVAESETDRIGIEHLEIASAPRPRTRTVVPLREPRAEQNEPTECVASENASVTSLLPAAGHDADVLSVVVPPPPSIPRDLAPERLRALVDSCGGNVSRISRLTGLPRSTIRDRLKRVL